MTTLPCLQAAGCQATACLVLTPSSQSPFTSIASYVTPNAPSSSPLYPTFHHEISPLNLEDDAMSAFFTGCKLGLQPYPHSKGDDLTILRFEGNYSFPVLTSKIKDTTLYELTQMHACLPYSKGIGEALHDCIFRKHKTECCYYYTYHEEPTWVLREYQVTLKDLNQFKFNTYCQIDMKWNPEFYGKLTTLHPESIPRVCFVPKAGKGLYWMTTLFLKCLSDRFGFGRSEEITTDFKTVFHQPLKRIPYKNLDSYVKHIKKLYAKAQQLKDSYLNAADLLESMSVSAPTYEPTSWAFVSNLLRYLNLMAVIRKTNIMKFQGFPPVDDIDMINIAKEATTIVNRYDFSYIFTLQIVYNSFRYNCLAKGRSYKATFQRFDKKLVPIHRIDRINECNCFSYFRGIHDVCRLENAAQFDISPLVTELINCHQGCDHPMDTFHKDLCSIDFDEESDEIIMTEILDEEKVRAKTPNRELTNMTVSIPETPSHKRSSPFPTEVTIMFEWTTSYDEEKTKQKRIKLSPVAGKPSQVMTF